MTGNVDERLGRAARAWVERVRPRARGVVLAFLAATAGCLVYASGHLGLNSDEMALFREDVPFLKLREDFRRAFPKLVDPIVVMIDGDTLDLVEDAADRLASRLRQQPKLFVAVYQPGSGAFFEEHGLLYLTSDALEDLADRLAGAQPFLAELSRDPSLRGFLGLLGEASRAAGSGDLDPESLADVLERTGRAFEAQLDGSRYQLSWAEVMLGASYTGTDPRHFLLVQPVLDFEELAPAERSLVALRRASSELELDGTRGVRARMTGTWPLSSEEAHHVRSQSTLAGVAAFFLVAAVLVRGLRSLRLVVASLLTLLVGLALTAGFAAAAIGHLNLISVTFAVLFIGLSIDFAIHFCIHYDEIRRRREPGAALGDAAQDVGGSLAICAVTTAIGFYAFVPTDYRGVAELGLIAGTGMLISLLTNLTLLPALLVLMTSGSRPAAGPRATRGTWLVSLPVRHAGAVCALTAVLAFAAALLLPRWHFDPSPLRLRDPGTESVQTFNDLLADGKAFPWNLEVLAADRAAADAVAARLAALDAVDYTVTLSDLVPADQEEKLAILGDAALLLGPALTPRAQRARPMLAEQLAALAELERGLGELEPDAVPPELRRAAERLRAALAAFRVHRLRDPAAAGPALEAVEASLLASLDERLRLLRRALATGPVGFDDLPPELLETMIAADGRFRVQIYPREDLNDNAALTRYVRQIQSLAPDA